jgi:hypothetical protein
VTNSDGTITKLTGIGSNGVGSGFFDAANPQTFNLGMPILEGPSNGLVLTSTGIFQVNGALVFASTSITAFTTLGDEIVAGFDDGTIGLLTETNGKFAESLTFEDAELTNPSALELVNVGALAQIYATTAGESELFVFTFSERSQTTSVLPVTEAGVAIVAALVSGNAEVVLDSGGEPGFVVGLGEPGLTKANTVLTSGSGDGFEGGAGETSETSTPLSAFVSGIADAVRLSQQRLAGAEAGGGAAPQEGGADWLGILDKVYTPFAQSPSTLGEVIQVPLRAGVYPFQALDALMRSGMKLQNGSGGMDGVGFGLEAILKSVQRAAHQAGSSFKRCLDTFYPLGPGKGQPPLPMTANELPDLDGLPACAPGACAQSEWQADLAAAFVLGGFWQARQREEDQRQFARG